ncbi:MAG: glycosyl transferase family 2, partial [Saprospiraceae bacterium]|nr:glycosyl transferase family 2 [Saprospiraceae bacterium]
DKASSLDGFEESILFMTDASVMLDPNCLVEMVKHFKNPEVFLVDATMKSIGTTEGGISASEGMYIEMEGRLKTWVSKATGIMMGPFGGCYCIRASSYHPVPPTFLVDDFYITMKGYADGGLAINEEDAVCYEKVGVEQKEEYKRKRRISSGNFQNMVHFFDLWFPPVNALGFSFFSHKVLRWCGPFFIIFALAGLTILVITGTTITYQFLFVSLVLWLIVLPLLDRILGTVGLRIGILRNIRYFNVMNWALLQGFFKYIYGIKSNVWQPPKRS